MFPSARTVVRRVLTLLAVLPLFVLCDGCNGFWVSDSSVQSVTVSPAAVLLKAGNATPDTYTLSSTSVTVGGTSTTDTATAKWTSSNTAAVTAASGGVITAVGSTGNLTATITATDGGQSGTANVLTYTGTAPTTLNLGIPSNIIAASLAPGSTFQVTASAALSGNASANLSSYVTWSITNNAAGATIDVNGNVTVPSTGLGAFTVNATATFGSAASQGTATGTIPFTVI